jgi:hypothetical protein
MHAGGLYQIYEDQASEAQLQQRKIARPFPVCPECVKRIVYGFEIAIPQ